MFEEKFKDFLDIAVGIDNITALREDFKFRFLDITDFSDAKIDISEKTSLITSLPKRAKKKQRRIEGYAFIIGITVTLFGLFFGFFWLDILAFYLAILSLEIAFRKVTIDILAFKEANVDLTVEELIFREAWNRAILQNALSLALIPLAALIMSINNAAYEKGMDIAMDYLERRI